MSGRTEQPFILDTHSWIWLLDGRAELDESEFVSEAETASAEGRLFVCSISIAEVALLVSAERVRLVVPVSTWLHEALDTPGLQLIEIGPELAAEGARLPGSFPGDAADRLIVAATRLAGGRLATADPLLQQYGAEGHVEVLPVPV